MLLENKVAVVTGAAQGNGRAIAQRLAAEGALVVCGDVNEAELGRTVQAIAAVGGRAESAYCDVTQLDDVDALMAIAESLGGPQAVVAQAGTRFGATVEDTTPEEWDRVMAIDAKGTFLTVRAAIAPMRRLGGGSIVTMSGTFAYYAEPCTAAHCAAKGAILSFTRAVAVECAELGIRCNAIVPAYIATPMVTDYLDAIPDRQAVERQIARWHALGRLGQPEEIAALAAFLCSDESSFCTGQPFIIDGGLSAGINTYESPIGSR